MLHFLKKRYAKLQKLLKRHPFFHFFRCFVITRQPRTEVFEGEAINNYNSKKSIPASFVKENSKIEFSGKGSFEKAMSIGRFMVGNYAGGRGLGYSSAETLEIMKANKGGVCSDFSQMMINYCILNDVPVREWSLSEKLYGSFGHVFNEVYCDRLNKWILLDIGKCFYFIDKQTKSPLSTTEYIDLLTSGKEERLVTINTFTQKEDTSLKLVPAIFRAYFSKENIFFLITDYRIGMMDMVLKLRKYFPLPVLHFGLISFGAYYKYNFYINKFNAESTRAKLAKIGRKNYGESFLKKQSTPQKIKKFLQASSFLLVQVVTDIA